MNPLRGAWLALVVLAGCALPPSSQVLYRCAAGDTCLAEERCWSDGYCHPVSDGADPADAGAGGGSGSDGGADAGGGSGADSGVDAGIPDSGSDAGLEVDAGLDAGAVDAGTDAGIDAGPCMPLTQCPASAECGAFYAGCGVVLQCGQCATPTECGTNTPNVCGMPKLCTQGFCWENPLPQGNTLFGVFSVGPRSVWAVGELGTVLFWNGERTALLDVGTTADLRAVHGSAANDVYVVGDQGTIVHFDGLTWQRETTPGVYRINTVWAGVGGLAFAGANGGSILKRDSPGNWSEMSFNVSSTADIVGLVGLETGELYATSLGRVFRLPSVTANTWQADTNWVGTNRDTLALSSNQGQLFAGGKISGQNYGVLLERLADAGWQQFGARVPGGFFAIAAQADAGQWVASQQTLWRVERDGGLEAFPLARDAGLFAVTATSADGVFTVGEFGTMATATDAGVRELSSGETITVNGVCADGRVYGPAQGQTVYERRTNVQGVRWDAVTRPQSGVTRWYTCFADGPDRVWVMGDNRTYLRQSMGVFTPTDAIQNSDWYGVWGSATGPVYFVNGAQQLWSSATGDTPTYNSNVNGGANGIFGVADNDVLIVTNNGNLRGRGTVWADVTPPQSGRTLRAVHAQRFTDGGVLYSVVGTGTAWRRVNGTFIADTIPAGHTLRGTWVAPSGEIWAGGDDGGTTPGRAVLWHYTADAGWESLPPPTPRAINGLGGYADNGPWLVGNAGIILRHVGADGG